MRKQIDDDINLRKAHELNKNNVVFCPEHILYMNKTTYVSAPNT